MNFKKIFQSRIFLVVFTILCFGFIIGQTIRSPEFQKINTFEVKSFDNGIVKAEVNLGIFNSNWFSIKGKELEFKMLYKDRLIAIGSAPVSINLRKRSLSSVPIDLEVYPDSLQSDLKDILLKDSILVDVDITGKFTFLGVQANRVIPTWLKTDDLIEAMVLRAMSSDGLKLDSIKLINASIKSSTFSLSFDFKNALNLTIELKTMNFSIYSEKTKENKVAEAKFQVNKEIPYNTSENIQGDVKLDNLKSVLSSLSKVLSGKLDYYLDGYALIALKGREIKIPIFQHFILDPSSKKIIIIKDND